MAWPRIFALFGLALSLGQMACGGDPGEVGRQPALLVEPASLEFGPDDDVLALQVTNRGTVSVAFATYVTVPEGQPDWLSVEPSAGVVAGGGAASLVVRVSGRRGLGPGHYEGTIDVGAQGATRVVVPVTLAVGAPVLAVNRTELAFGDAQQTLRLEIANVGSGSLAYSVSLPGPWMTAAGPTSGTLLADSPLSLALSVDRSQVPWYGEGAAAVLVASNGLDSEEHPAARQVSVSVTVPAECFLDAGCVREGYFCALPAGGGVGRCTPRRGDGLACSNDPQCASGHCVAGVCCDQLCDSACRTCTQPEHLGRCVPRPDGTACSDGLRCTEDDRCEAGLCTAGPQRDCSGGGPAACTEGRCLEPSGECVTVVRPDRCRIGGLCYLAGEERPGGCAHCDPATSAEAWTPSPEGDCDDGDPCTENDRCAAGVCAGVAKDCDDGLACSRSHCDPATGECRHEPLAEWCLIDGACVPAGAGPPGFGTQCAVCTPRTAPTAWTPLREGLPCEDDDVCSAASVCAAGHCVALGPLCDDGDPCTEDRCEGGFFCEHSPANEGSPCSDPSAAGYDCAAPACQAGRCAAVPRPGHCLIEGHCYEAGDPPPEAAPQGDGACRLCAPDAAPDRWTAINEGFPCDDGLFCTVEDVCRAGSCEGEARRCEAPVCNEGVCSEAIRGCVTLWAEFGLPCDDGDACTEGDECSGGRCQGRIRDCSRVLGPIGPCLEAFCEPESEPEPGECRVRPVHEGAACETGTFCAIAGVCEQGACRGLVRECAGGPCARGLCDPDTDACTLAPDPAALGRRCEDGLACTVESECQEDGACAGGRPKTSEDCLAELGTEEPCFVGVCEEPGGCVLHPAEDGAACAAPHATEARCGAGRCEALACAPGYGDCSQADPADGCETPLASTPEHCGGCGQVCVGPPHTIQSCEDGRCVTYGCERGYADCDGDPATGCEVDTREDPEHCGGCNEPCPSSERFVGAVAACREGSCLFLGCLPGFVDANHDCLGGVPGLDGCEACEPIAEGGVEIPDDGSDDDCDGQDSSNDEERGVYVDPSFPFGAECPGPGEGTRACPFETLETALWQVQHAQDWEAPAPGQREVYLAAGLYSANDIVASLSKPVLLLGGYRRTVAGPWMRDVVSNATVLRSMSEVAVFVSPDVPGWAVLDGLTIGPRVSVNGRLFARRIRSSGPLSIGSVTNAAVLWLRSSDVSGDVEDEAGSHHWTLEDNRIGGSVRRSVGGATSQDWVLVDNDIRGSIDAPQGGPLWGIHRNHVAGDVVVSAHPQAIEGNEIGGGLSCGDGRVQGNTITGELTLTSSSCTLAANRVAGPLTSSCGLVVLRRNRFLQGLLLQRGHATLIDNDIVGPVVATTALTLAGNRIVGDVESRSSATVVGNTVRGALGILQGHSSVVAHNAIYFPPERDGDLIALETAGCRVVNNALIAAGSPQGGHFGIREANDLADPSLFLHNAFIGFRNIHDALYVDEGDSLIVDAAALDRIGDLAPCARGGNLALVDPRAAGFVSLDPDSPGFLLLRAESPLRDAGASLPVACDGVLLPDPSDEGLGGLVPCGASFDIGAHEFCPGQP